MSVCQIVEQHIVHQVFGSDAYIRATMGTPSAPGQCSIIQNGHTLGNGPCLSEAVRNAFSKGTSHENLTRI